MQRAKTLRTSVLGGRAWGLAVGVLGTLPAWGAPLATIGIDDSFGFAISNESTGGEVITSATITFTSGTFFDTTSAVPGVLSSGFLVFGESGTTGVTLPSDAATDGLSTATLGFGEFDPGEAIHIDVDLDNIADVDSSGLPIAGEVTVTFDGSTVLSAPIEELDIEFSDFSLTLPFQASVPEPGVGLALLLGGGGLIRRRR